MARARRSGASKLTHFVHGPSAGGSIVQLLRELERNEEVVYLGDDLSFGPINPPDPGRRAAWCLEHWIDAWWSQRNARRFWEAAVAPTITPVIWFSRRSAAEYASLHEIVWRRREAPLVIDVAEVPLLTPNGVDASISVGYIRHELMIEHDFLERARCLTPEEVDRMRTDWHWLRAADSALRIVDSDGLRSVSITHFDELMVSFVADQWTRGGWVIGETLAAIEDSGFRHARTDLLWSRILSLVADGHLEGNGVFDRMQGSLVRRPPTRRRPRR